jgi:CHAT domain-containing protein
VKNEQSKAYASLNAANIAAGRKRFEEAAGFYNATLKSKVSDKSVFWNSYAGLARVTAASGNERLARTCYEKAISTVDFDGTQWSRDEYEFTFRSSLIRFYRDYVEFLMQHHDAEHALDVVESSRAHLLSRTSPGRKFPRRLTSAELRLAAKRSGTVFLSYWLAPAQSYVWVVTPEGIQHFALGPSAAIEPLVPDQQTIANWDLYRKENPDAKRLFDIVLGPVAKWIPPHARVIVVPDGALHYLNFETLPVHSEKPNYWIEDATVAVAPSLAIAATASPGQDLSYKSALIMGDPVNSGLPNAATEIIKVASYFAPESTKKFQQGDATPAAYRNAHPESYSVIHFSAHGEANAQSPLDSAILLSPGQDRAYKLYARDVIDSPLNANLVTISACHSAGARVYSGEGLVGFAWAFMRAGAHYVVAGLWDITDSSTPAVMDEFYGAIRAGKSPPDALRAAKLSMLHSETNFRKPYYWGPFQIYIGFSTRSRH